MKVYNKSKRETEPATKETCPRCKGFGARMNDARNCNICEGQGIVWVSRSGSGWTRALYHQLEDSQLF